MFQLTNQPDFMFQLTNQEVTHLRSQYAISSSTARSEHGALMAAHVLNSPRAVEASVYVVRAFVRLREMIATHKELARKLDEIERKLATRNQAIADLIEAIGQMMNPPLPERRGSDFVVDDD
jgi:hypothetical protein